MADIFSTNVVNGVVASLIQPPSFLLDRFFPNMQTETTEEIHFDTIVKTRPADAEKISLIRDIVAKHINVKKIIDSL